MPYTVVPTHYASSLLTRVNILLLYSYTAGELDLSSDKGAEQRALLVESRR